MCKLYNDLIHTIQSCCLIQEPTGWRFKDRKGTSGWSLLAKAVVGHECLYELVFLHILDRIDAECNTLCQRNAVPPSVFWKIPVSQLGVYSTGKVAWTNYSQRLHHCCRSSQRSQATVTIATRRTWTVLTFLASVWQLQSSWRRETRICVGCNHFFPFSCLLHVGIHKLFSTLMTSC